MIINSFTTAAQTSHPIMASPLTDYRRVFLHLTAPNHISQLQVESGVCAAMGCLLIENVSMRPSLAVDPASSLPNTF